MCCVLGRTGHLIVGNADGNGEGPRSMCVVDSATFRLPSAGQEWNQDIVVQCCSPTNGPQSRPGCEEAKTWSEAHDVCEGTGAGLRLCTEAEVLSGGGRGKGCGFDKSHTWVSGGCNLAHPTCNDINGNGTAAFVCPEGSSQPKDSFNTVTCANTTGCTVAECCTSFEVMDISFSTQNWVLSNAGENPPRIDGNVLTIQGDSSRYRLASITLDMPETIDGENNLYFVADVTLRDIVCPEALHWKRPKMAIYNGEDAGNTGAVAIAATYMDPHATDFEFATGSTVMTYAGKVRSGVLSSRMTFEIVLAGCEGTMMVARPKLLNREPTPKIVYPYPNVTEAVATVDLQQDSIKPWNHRLFGANSQFVASKVGSYESSAVSGLLATIRVPELRFPGGKAANYYNWREDRLYDDLWTREDLGRAKTVDRNFTFGFDYFCQSVRASNGSAILVFNVVKDTLQDAVERLRDRLACGLSIDYIELGNENNYKAQSQGKAGGQNATKYAMWTEKIAAALRQELPSVRLSVPLEHHSTWEPGSWNMVLLQEYDYYDAASMHPYANVMGPVFGAAIVKGLLGARSQMEHFVKAYLHAGFAGVPLVLSEWGINYDQGSSPWGLRGNWAFSLAEADMMLYALELGEKGIVDQSSKHILATDFGQGFFKWNGTQFVARPSGAWFLKFIEAARGGYSVKVNVSATMLDPKLGVSSLNAVAFRKTGEYNVLMVNKFDQNAVVKITIDSGGNNRGIRGCEVESLSLDLTDNPMYEMGSDPFSAPSSFDCQTVSVPKLSVAVIRVVVPTCADIDGSGGSFSSCSAGTELAANADVASCYSGYCTASDCCVEVVTADVPSPSSPQATTAAVPSPSQQATQVNHSNTPAPATNTGSTSGGTGSTGGSNTNSPAPATKGGSTGGRSGTSVPHSNTPAPATNTGSTSGGTGSTGSNTNSPAPATNSGSTGEGSGTSNTGSASTTPSSEPTSNAIPDVEVEYAVEHTIILKGISANQFNEDPLIVESFLESVSKLLNVPITDIFNVVAISKNRLRNLDGSAACDVSYEVKVNSVTEMNTMSSNIQDTFTNNKAGDTTFTAALQTAMAENNVSSIELSSITSDTTSAPKDAGTLNLNNSNEGNTEVGNDDSKDNTVPVEPDKQNVDIGLIAGLSIGGLLILSLVGYVFFARSKRIININIPSVGVEMSDSTIKMKDMGYANPMNMNKMRV